MKRFFFFGSQVVPLKKYIATYKEQLERNAKLKIQKVKLEQENNKLRLEYNALNGKYNKLQQQMPKRGEGGRFVAKDK